MVGSNWSKWDLHVHTPASIVNSQYGGDTDEAWEKFICDLEALPADFKVLGINDYIFIDGYKRLAQAKASGRIANIDLLLPVIELRLATFVGTESKLQKVNFHVIFSEKVTVEQIDSQFISTLASAFVLSPLITDLEPAKEAKVKNWNALPTKASLAELGQMLIDGAPEDKKAGYGSALTEGFNAYTVDYGKIKAALENHHFKGKHITAIGKAEWDALKWNDQSVATKKTIINSANMLFTAAESEAAFAKAKRALTEAKVNNTLLDCSDAHAFSTDETNKDRVGNCLTWIKAKPTFEGLKQAIIQPKYRIYVGQRPDKLSDVDTGTSRYISAVKVRRDGAAPANEKWFDGTDVALNVGLNAIIGRKGSGKSALLDIVAKTSGCDGEHFSFLTKGRFLEPSKKLGNYFEATVEWMDGKPDALLLGNSSPIVENRVRYLSQEYMEKVCANPAQLEDERFHLELKSVIYSHLSEEKRGTSSNLDELIFQKTSQVEEKQRRLQEEIRQVNKLVVHLENEVSTKARLDVQQTLDLKLRELEGLEKSPLKVVPPPVGDDATKQKELKLEALRNEHRTTTGLLEAAKEKFSKLGVRRQKLLDALASILVYEEQGQALSSSLEGPLKEEGIEVKAVFNTIVNRAPIDDKLRAVEVEMETARKSIDESRAGSLGERRKLILDEGTKLKADLGKPQAEYQAYLQQQANWENKKKELIGSAEKIGSILQLKERQKELSDSIPARIESLRKHRYDLFLKLLAVKWEASSIYKELYAPITEFIQKNELAKKYELRFEVATIVRDLDTKLTENFDQRQAGPFQNSNGGAQLFENLKGNFDSGDDAKILVALKQIEAEIEGGSGIEKRVETVQKQLRSKVERASIYDLLWLGDYLKSVYYLKLGDKELAQLSPGEKGALLLTFFLLVDKSCIPLLIDQPEENLDNETVVDLLVPAIAEARNRRQILIATHNPNLAIVCDADLIVHAWIDKADGNQVSYFGGAIEDDETKNRVVKILEGTEPAFMTRKSKYRID